MKALLLKDLYLLKRQLRIVLIVMALYAVLFVPQGMLDTLGFMAVMFCTMYGMTLISYDETLKWDSYALCGPLTRRDLVRARYLSTLIMMAAGLLLSLLLYLVVPLFVVPPRPLKDSLTILVAAVLAALLMLSLIIPGMIKLGAEKGRLLMIAGVMVPVGGAVLYDKYAPAGLVEFFRRYASYIPATLALLVVCAFFASYRVSLRIYNNKDF